jgi:hypothetical protein
MYFFFKRIRQICDELESRLQAALWRHLDPNKAAAGC